MMYTSSTVMLFSFLILFGTLCSGMPAGSIPVKRDAPTPSMDGSPVVFGPGTYPRANKLSDGDIIGAYTAFKGGDTVIETVLSSDNGQSWTYQGEVTRGPSDMNDIDNPYILQLPSGRLLCAIRNHSKDASSGAYQYFRITVTYSDDNGKSWAFLSQPAADPGPVTGSWEPFLRNAQDGSLQLYYSRENSKFDQDTLQHFSSDGGKTWTEAQTISGSDITSRDGMTGVVTVSGSTVMAVFETESTGIFSIGAITSNDDGKTWGDRRTIYTPDNPNTSAGAPQIVNVGGNLAVSFMTNEDQSLAVPSDSYMVNTAAKLITSGDGGKTWGNKKTIGQAQSVWPGLHTLDDSSFLYMFDNGGAKAQKLTFG